MDQLKKNIRNFVVENFLFGQEDGLTDDSSFLEQGIVDSTGVLELVAYIEKAHGIKVKDEELIPDNLDSIESVAGYIKRKRKQINTDAA